MLFLILFVIFDSDLVSLTNWIGVLSTVRPRHCNSNNCKAEVNLGTVDVAYTVMVWAFICE